MTRLLVIVLSEASPHLIDRFCADGSMPCLAKFKEGCLTGRTAYTTPYLLTPQMWSTILTGRGAGSHGVFDYWQRTPTGGFRETCGADIKGSRLWDILNKSEVNSGFVNVPMTFPPPLTRGFSIAGQDAPGANPALMHPPGLYGEITAKFGRYHHKDVFPGRCSKADYGRVLVDETDRQARIFEWLVINKPWKFLMLYASATAFAQHYFWEDMDRGSPEFGQTVERTFSAADRMVARVTRHLGSDDHLMIISECGAGPIGSGVNLNNWLSKEGFLVRRSEKPSFVARRLSGFRAAAPKLLPPRLHALANRLPIKSWIQDRITSDKIDWRRTQAFYRGKGEGNIYINRAGRDRNGIVPHEEYESVREAIISRLEGLVDPATGQKAIRAVHRREEVFDGPFVESAPDLVVEWTDFRYMPDESAKSNFEIFSPRVREYMDWPTSGSHRREGFLLIRAPSGSRGILENSVDLRNLAPTWLDILNVPPPPEFEGAPIRF